MKWVTTTPNSHGLPIYPNLIKPLTINNVNQLLLADITYIRILTCFVYLTLILDSFPRKAICDRQPEPGWLPHSDRGVQYASREYAKEPKFYNFQISMSTKGSPNENAHAESLIKTLKSEEVHL